MQALQRLIKLSVGRSNLRNFFTVMGVHTFVDMLAWALAQGIKLRDTATKFVKLFMQKVMRILGIRERVASDNPNQGFFRFLLNTLLQRLNEWAQSAVSGIES
ncbi:hypothetical protein [Teredinibacter turnerae]|uniref:hypothetical protein n=1 Tax=Teredinibacter turnerae TaxID=2426 RepID=UPI000379E63A|nr:hypothetical protein [Teredinibacter turnerae]